MTDLSSLSNDQLQALYAQSKPADLSAMSDAELTALHKQSVARENTPTDVKMFKRVWSGIREPVDAAAQMLERGAQRFGVDTKAINAKVGMPSADQAYQKAEENYRSTFDNGQKPSFDPLRMAGNVIGTAPIAYAMPGAAAASLPARMASGAASGAVSGTLAPVEPSKSNDEFWKEKGKQAAFGGVLGAAAPAVASAISRVISPRASTNPQIQTLMDEGVTPTPGQLLGKGAAVLEDKAKSLPMIGGGIANAQGRALEDFNRAAINRTLTPLGESLPKHIEPGREAVDYAANRISEAYDKLLPKLNVVVDQKFGTEVNNILAGAKGLPNNVAGDLEGIIKDRVLARFNNGQLTGKTMKEIESELGTLAKQYMNSTVASEKNVGIGIREVQNSLRDLVERSNPQHAGQLQSINKAFANLVRVERAAGSAGAVNGVFTAPQLSQAVRMSDSSSRRAAYSRGDALMQDLSDAGRAVLGSKYPDSGTAGRQALWQIPAAVGGAYSLGGTPAAAAASAPYALGALGRLAYTQPAQNALATLIARRPNAAPQVAAAVQNSAPAASAALPLLARGLLGP